MSGGRLLATAPRAPCQERAQAVGPDGAAGQAAHCVGLRAAPGRAAAEAPLPRTEVRGELALAALPIPWPVLLRASHHPRAGLLPMLPAAAAAIAAALPLDPRVAAALPSAALTVGQVRPAAEGLQQLLLLLVLLAQCIEQAAEVSIPASAVADARNASAAAATRPAAAHRRGG